MPSASSFGQRDGGGSRGVRGPDPFPGVFNGASGIDRTGDKVEVLATTSTAGAVAVREGKILATTFHPELSTDTRFHEIFLHKAARNIPTPR